MEKNTVLLQDTEAFMHGELDNVTVQQNCIVLDLVQGGYVPYGCYTSAPIPMPLFDALRVSWNAASPEDTAVEAQVRVMVDGNWTTWNSFGKWSPSLHREGPPYQARGPVQRWPDRLQLDSKYATAVQLRIYLYSKNEKVSPAVMLLGASVRVVDVIPARGRLVNARLHLMPYTAARRAPALQPWMDAAISRLARPRGRRPPNPDHHRRRGGAVGLPRVGGLRGLGAAARRGPRRVRRCRYIAIDPCTGRRRSAGAALRSAARVCIVAGRRTQGAAL